jgi:dienelactone hydrolase
VKGADVGLRPLLVTADGKEITTRSDWNKARRKLRDAWLARLGKPPDKPDRLDVRIETTEKLDGYTRQLLSFHSEGGDRIRAYLLVPQGLKAKEKRPAVVVFHPTTPDTLREPVGLGKKPGTPLAVELVRRGYITLSPECYILKGKDARAQAAALARRRPGWTGLGKVTFDGSRCLDFLETLPAVDRQRFACIGHSLGAKEVLFAMAFEPRYRAGVFNEGGIGLRMSNWTDPWYLTDKMKPHIPALENHQVLALIAPRPFLVLGGDSADGDASWTFIKAALPVYQLLGAGDRVGLFNHKGKHSFPPEARRLAYQWLDDWLRFTPTRESKTK